MPTVPIAVALPDRRCPCCTLARVRASRRPSSRRRRAATITVSPYVPSCPTLTTVARGHRAHRRARRRLDADAVPADRRVVRVHRAPEPVERACRRPASRAVPKSLVLERARRRAARWARVAAPRRRSLSSEAITFVSRVSARACAASRSRICCAERCTCCRFVVRSPRARAAALPRAACPRGSLRPRSAAERARRAAARPGRAASSTRVDERAIAASRARADTCSARRARRTTAPQQRLGRSTAGRACRCRRAGARSDVLLLRASSPSAARACRRRAVDFGRDRVELRGRATGSRARSRRRCRSRFVTSSLRSCTLALQVRHARFRARRARAGCGRAPRAARESRVLGRLRVARGAGSASVSASHEARQPPRRATLTTRRRCRPDRDRAAEQPDQRAEQQPEHRQRASKNIVSDRSTC